MTDHEPRTYACADLAPLLPNRCRWEHHFEDVTLRCFERPATGAIECRAHLEQRLAADLDEKTKEAQA